MTKQPGVICIGEVLIDLLSEEPGKSWKAVNLWTPYTGGAPANVAIALKRLGMRTAFIGCVGNDESGTRLLAEMNYEGIDTHCVQVTNQFPTRKVYVERSNTGERFFAGFGENKTSDFADTRIIAASVPNVIFEKYTCLVLGTLMLPYPLSREAVLLAIKNSKKAGLLLAMDVNWRPVFWPETDIAIKLITELILEMDIVKFSKEEAEWLLNTSSTSEIIRLLPNASVILVTDGENGCHYYINGYHGFLRAFKVHSVDTTGAGDNFFAGFLFHYIMCRSYTERSVKEIMRFASAMGAMCTTHAGAVSTRIFKQDIDHFLLHNQNE